MDPFPFPANNLNINQVTHLIWTGTDPNRQYAPDGKTLLHHAVKSHRPDTNNHFDIVEYLILNGANINAIDNDHDTPLHFAVQRHHLQNYPYAENNDIEMVKWLLNHGADINAINNHGRTPLHRAIEWQNIETAKYLLDHGADPNIYDHMGSNAGDMEAMCIGNSCEISDYIGSLKPIQTKGVHDG